MRPLLILVATLAVVAGGCRRFEFSCTTDTECVRGGVLGRCLSAGRASYCAFDHANDCVRWDETATSSLANQCVTGLGDGGSSDMPTFDMGITAGCSVTADLLGVWGASASDVWAVGTAGTVLHFDTEGCHVQSNTTQTTLRAVWGSSAEEVYVVGDGFTMRSTDRGVSWKPGNGVATQTQLWGVWGTGPIASGGTVYAAVGRHTNFDATGGLYKTTDGTTWSPITSINPSSSVGLVASIWGADASNVWAVGAGGQVLRLGTGGVWNSSTIAIRSGYLTGITGIAPNTLYAVTTDGEIWRAADGSNWNSIYSPMANQACNGTGFSAIWAADANHIYAVGANGCVMSSTDGVLFHGRDARDGPYTANFNGVWLGGQITIVVGSAGVVVQDPAP